MTRRAHATFLPAILVLACAACVPRAQAQAPPERERLVVHGTGDVNLDPAYIPALAANGYEHAWEKLGGSLPATT